VSYVISNDAGRNTGLDKYADLPVWLCWQNEEQRGKPTKVPWSPTSNAHASSTDHSTWSTRAIAEGSALANGRTGIGIVLAEIDKGRHLGGIDLDSCIDAEGELTPWGREVVELVGSYAEISPSGRGLKIFFEYDPRETEGVRWRSQVQQPALDGGKDHAIEFYLDRRYFTVTRNTFENFDTVRRVGLDTLRDVQCLMEVFADKATHPLPPGNSHPRRHDDDQKRILDALASIPGEDTYAEWVRIGMALHVAERGSDEGYRAFIEWSAKSGKFDEGHCKQKWQEWDRSPARNLTGGTIIYLARRNGWPDPHQAKTNGAVKTPVPNGTDEKAAAPSIEWPPPGPIVAELKPVLTFDAETLLPDALRPWIMDEAERMPCPPEFIAVPAMVALGSIVGARCAIKPKARDPWQIVPNLWGGIVGDPSDKKSPAWGAALKPLDRLIAKAVEAHQAECAEYETERVVFEAQKDAIEGRIKEAAKKASKGDPAAIAKELRTHTDGAPKAPALRRYRTNDSTVEKLGELLRDNPAGLLVLRDELVGLIANWDREGREGERAFFLESWNGDQAFDTDRIGRGHISIANLCVAIFGGVQPDKLVVYLEQAAHALANDGMLQRFQLLVYPDPRPWEWRDRLPDKTARDAAYDVFNKLAEFDPATWGASAADEMTKFPWFRFDDEAQQIFIEWSADLHRTRMPAEDDPIIRQHLAKYDKLFPALALILHLVDAVATGSGGPVTRQAALRASAWCEFLEAHARRCYGLLKDDGLRAAQALAAKLVRNKLEDGFTLRDVRRNQWRSLTTDETIQAALDWLEDEDWLRSESTGGTGPGTGRRTVSYKINPGIARRGKGEST
jgi:hypothetical protein